MTDDRDAWVYSMDPEQVLAICCPPQSPARQPTPVEPIGALFLWRQELRRGVRTLATADTLALAAAYEAAGHDLERLGRGFGAACFTKAAEVVVEAIARKAAA